MTGIKKIAFFLIVAMSSVSCFDSIEPVYLVTIERDFNIPANLPVIPTHFFELKNIPTFYNENLTINGMSADEVTTVFPGDGNVTAIFENIDWSFVETLELYAVSQENSADKRRMFFADQADFVNRNQVGMFNVLIDIKDIVENGFMDLEVRIKTRQFVPQNISARIIFTYGVFDTE